MFGYLNLNDPRDIANNEAQEANNCRVDRGRLEHATWSVDATRNREFHVFQEFLRDYYIDDDGFVAEFVKRDGSGITGDYPGLPKFPATTKEFSGGVLIDASSFSYLASLSEVWPNPDGEYEYAFTYYDPLWGEEGPPRLFSVTVTSAAAPEMTFKVGGNSSEYDATHSGKTLYVRIYRRPLGATEFLFVGQATTVVGSGSFPTFTDTVADTDLGEVLETEDYIRIGTVPPSDATAKSPTVTKKYQLIAWFREKLFLAKDNVLEFSVTGQPGFSKSAFALYFDDTITDLEVKDETLIISTTKEIYALYGSDESDFQLRNIGGTTGAVSTSMMAIAERVVLAEYGARNVVIGTTPTSFPFAESLQGLSGTTTVSLSDKIQSLFPLFPAVVNSTDLRFVNGKLNNRYCVLKYSEIAPSTVFASSAALLVAVAVAMKHLILDVNVGGFLTSDGGSTFQYRTKEFGELGKLSQFRAGYVVAEGQFDLEIYGDGQLLTTHSFNLSAKTRQRFTVKSQRCNTFSFRFIGQSNAIIYEYGRLE